MLPLSSACCGWCGWANGNAVRPHPARRSAVWHSGVSDVIRSLPDTRGKCIVRRMLVLLALGLCCATPGWAQEAVAAPLPASQHRTSAATRLIESARARTLIGEIYDPAYVAIAYPGGDVPDDRGVCTDVVIRAYRSLGIDLQVEVHEDMKANFARYPKLWGLDRTDRNIDHRRVPNLETFFQRHGVALPVSEHAAAY